MPTTMLILFIYHTEVGSVLELHDKREYDIRDSLPEVCRYMLVYLVYFGESCRHVLKRAAYSM